MIRRATIRLLVATMLSVIGALAAILGGVPDAALLVAPWTVLLALGLSNARNPNIGAKVEIAENRVVVGDEVDVEVKVSGADGTALVTIIPDASFWDPRADPAKSPVIRVADVLADRASTTTCSLPALVWGNHDLGRVRVDALEPHGLFRWSGVIHTPANIRVHPTQTELRNLLNPWLVRRVTGAHRSRAVGQGVEYADIREFAPSDSLRDINWRASARSQELWVSQRHPDRASNVILMLDSFVESGHDVRRIVGLAIEAAVALAESHLSATDRVGLVDMGGVIRWVAPGTGQMQLQKLTDCLLQTGLYSNPTDKQISVIPARALPPRSFVMALSPLLDNRFVDALFVLSASGHDVAVVECPALWADEDTHEQTELAGLAMRMWQAEREALRDRLFESGVSIATWDEEQHLDLVLDELTRRRRRGIRVVQR